MVSRFSVKYAGILYLVGDGVLFLFGDSVNNSWCESLAGAGFIGNALILSRKGDDPRWFALTSFISIPLNILMVFDRLVARSGIDWIGVCIMITSNLFGGFSVSLNTRFRHAHNGLVRCILGHPRKTMGILLILGKLPLLFDSVLNENLILIACLALWILGDLLMGLLPIIPSRLDRDLV